MVFLQLIVQKFFTRLDSRETFTTESFSDGTAAIISGSSTSTGSFGVLKLDGGEFTSSIIENLVEIL